MLRPLIALALLLSLSCADKEPPVAPSAFDEQVEPWQTITINDVPYRRAAAKANATAQSSDLLISIPIRYIDGQISLPDTVVIAGRIYRANCSAPGSLPPVTDDEPSVSINPDRAVLIAFYQATGGGSAWTGDNWVSDEPIGAWEGVTTNADGRVTHLDLPRSQLSGSIPAELGLLANLKNSCFIQQRLKRFDSFRVRSTDQPEIFYAIQQRLKRFDSFRVRSTDQPRMAVFGWQRLKRFDSFRVRSTDQPEIFYAIQQRLKWFDSFRVRPNG